MGFRTLLEINHDNFSDNIGKEQMFVATLARFTRALDPEIAQSLDDDFNVRFIASRHSGDTYIIGQKADGFPTQLPFDEFIDDIAARRSKALAEAQSLLSGGPRKGRVKIDNLLDIISGLMSLISALSDDTEMREILTELFVRYQGMLEPIKGEGEGDHSPKHLYWMCQTALDHMTEYPTDKLNRWLSYVQCDLTHLNLTTVQAERDFTRPMFHAYYAARGLKAPPTRDRK